MINKIRKKKKEKKKTSRLIKKYGGIYLYLE
jgi:hypothetical protein